MFTSCDIFELKRTGTEPSLSLTSNGGLFIFKNFMSTNTDNFFAFEVHTAQYAVTFNI